MAIPAGPAQVSRTPTAWPRCLSNTVTVFAAEFDTKPAWSAIGLGGATAENAGLNENAVGESIPGIEARARRPRPGRR